MPSASSRDGFRALAQVMFGFVECVPPAGGAPIGEVGAVIFGCEQVSGFEERQRVPDW